MNTTKLSVSWSGGKDSTFMLYLLMQDDRYEIIELHTGISKETDRVSMHGVSRALIQAQADALHLPVVFLEIPSDHSNGSYERVLKEYFKDLKDRNIHHVAYGDIFLEDLKDYRDALLENLDLEGIYPLWKKDTTKLVTSFIEEGFKTIVCASKKDLFSQSICSEVISKELIQSLPKTVDPCGENGEFHTYVFDGPLFKNPILIETKQTTEHTYHFRENEEEKEVIFEFSDLELLK